MNSIEASLKKEESEPIKKINKLTNIKSYYFIQKLFDNLHEKKLIKIVKINKNMQNRLNININTYKEYCEKFSSIELEIVLAKVENSLFITISEKDKQYYHIYFDDNKEEIKRAFLTEKENVSKIKIIIDHEITSLQNLFFYSYFIESIKFKKFYRKNIVNMSGMFHGCSSLKELDLSNFRTDNVTDMNGMFNKCTSLKKLNLSNFNK